MFDMVGNNRSRSGAGGAENALVNRLPEDLLLHLVDYLAPALHPLWRLDVCERDRFVWSSLMSDSWTPGEHVISNEGEESADNRRMEVYKDSKKRSLHEWEANLDASLWHFSATCRAARNFMRSSGWQRAIRACTHAVVSTAKNGKGNDTLLLPHYIKASRFLYLLAAYKLRIYSVPVRMKMHAALGTPGIYCATRHAPSAIPCSSIHCSSQDHEDEKPGNMISESRCYMYNKYCSMGIIP